MKKQLLLLIFLPIQMSLMAQSWVELIHDSSKNFYDVQAAANDYFKDKDISQPGIGYKAYKRWEYYMEKRVYPSGDIRLPSIYNKSSS